MAELGVAPIVLGHIANHRTTTKAGITLGVYVQYAWEKEKRAALELWADRLPGIVDGAGGQRASAGASEPGERPRIAYQKGRSAHWARSRRSIGFQRLVRESARGAAC